jgi:GNAT superfamily N-acetyltransferase
MPTVATTLNSDLRFRLASECDAQAIASLHADSWRRHYRDVYSDAFLDGDVKTDRLRVWSQRLVEPENGRQTVLAEDDDGLVGFAHTVFNENPSWGALLDNLHVAHRLKRQGVGSRLLSLSAQAVVERRTGLYLWVNEQNRDAQAFYTARGGSLVERALSEAPGGIASRLKGTPVKLRCAWGPGALLTFGS